MNESDRLPVIVGVGDLADRAPLEESLEPLRLIARASMIADEDAGGGWLSRLDAIEVVNQVGWGYTDLAGSLAKEIGADAASARMSEIGGQMPIRLLVEIAEEIQRGRREVVLLAGGESLDSLARAMRAGTPPTHWTPPDPNVSPPRAEDHVTALALRYGLTNPTDVYPLYENACAAAWGQTSAEALAESAELWAAFSEVAAKQPAAWMTEPRSAAEIATPSPRNRPIVFPYTKLLTAQLMVNQGAAVILTSAGRARAAGIPEERLVWVWSGAGADEPDDFLARDRYDRSTAMNAALDGTLRANGLEAKDVGAFELYSCFPCVPKMARRRLGLERTVVPTVTGGLTFFGGPANDYMTHAIVAMARELRRGKAETGLLYGQGAFVTKHHAAIVARSAPSRPPVRIDAQPEAVAARGPVPPLLETYAGEATVETFTVTYGRDGSPARGTVIARTPSGARTVASCDDPETIALLERSEPVVGRRGAIANAGGDNRWSFRA